jgi:hypothetical protein
LSSASTKAAQRRAKIFISYKRGADPDEALAKVFHDALANAGCEPFYDRDISPSVDWETELDNKIETSDFFLLLLSHASADSQHVANEVATADQSAKRNGKRPIIVTVQVGDAGQPRFAMRSILRSQQQLKWNSDTDSTTVLNLLSALISNEGFSCRGSPSPQPSVSAMSELAVALRKALLPFASERARRLEFIDEHLYLVSTLDGLYKALALRLPPEEIAGIPAQEEDKTVAAIRNQVALLANYVDKNGKDRRLQDGFNNLIETIDRYLETIPRRRALQEAKGIAKRQMYQDLRVKQNLEIRDKTLQASEVITGISDFIAEQSRREKLINIEYDEKDRALKLEFARCYGEAKARTAAGLHQLAEHRQWSDSEWRFDNDSELWSRICNLTFQHDWDNRAAALESLLRQHPHDVWTANFYLHNVRAKDASSHQKHLGIAASIALGIPGSAMHDEVRMSIAMVAARSALAVLHDQQKGRRFGEADVEFAANTQTLWDIWAKYQSDFAMAECLEARVFSSAAAGRITEALNLAAARNANLTYSTEFSFTIARLAARAGDFGNSLEWLRFGLGKPDAIDVNRCRTEPDLEELRTQKSEEFRRLTTVRCEVICDNGLLFYDILLKNLSAFPLTNVEVTIIKGRSIKLGNRERIEPNETCKWAWVGAVVDQRNLQTSVSFFLKCSEGHANR